MLTKKEVEISKGASGDQIKMHSPHRLKQYIKLVRKLRNKYRDMTQRERSAQKSLLKNSVSFRNIEKSKFFDKVLLAFEKQARKTPARPMAKIKNRKTQSILDHEEHYDLDGVTRRHGKIIIPARPEISDEYFLDTSS